MSAMEAFDMIPKLGQTREDVDLHGEPKFRVAWTGAATDPEVTDGIFGASVAACVAADDGVCLDSHAHVLCHQNSGSVT